LSQIFNSRGIIFKIFREKTLIILKGSKSWIWSYIFHLFLN
jgi:hypothetical protein